MTQVLLDQPPATPRPAETPWPLTASVALGARVANMALTAQVQVAYACALAARDRARSAARCIERSWLNTPMRTLVVSSYLVQAQASDAAARQVLARARERCGLAFARVGPASTH